MGYSTKTAFRIAAALDRACPARMADALTAFGIYCGPSQANRCARDWARDSIEDGMPLSAVLAVIGGAS